MTLPIKIVVREDLADSKLAIFDGETLYVSPAMHTLLESDFTETICSLKALVVGKESTAPLDLISRATQIEPIVPRSP